MEYCSNLRPEDDYSHFWTAICAAKLQDYDKCFEHSSEAYRLHESDDTIAHLHAYALAKTERSDAAFELLRKLMEKKPEEIVLYVTEAYFHLWRADFLNAKKSYLRAIAKRQDDSLYNGLATASLALGEFDEALRYLSRARQKWPENNIIASNLEALTRLRKRPKEEQDKAISDLRSQLQRIPGFTALSVDYSMQQPAYDMILRTGGLRAYVSR